jgi:hypothetical protein
VENAISEVFSGNAIAVEVSHLYFFFTEEADKQVDEDGHDVT